MAHYSCGAPCAASVALAGATWGRNRSISKQPLGQHSVQSAHCTQAKRSMVQMRAARSTVRASAGHALAHRPQNMQSSTLIVTRPRKPAGASGVSKGYRRVSGRLNRPPSVIVPNPNVFMSTYLSVQLMHGSMVKMMVGTSARSHPRSACTMPARFCEVGVRTRMRSRFLVPLPCT